MCSKNRNILFTDNKRVITNQDHNSCSTKAKTTVLLQETELREHILYRKVYLF